MSICPSSCLFLFVSLEKEMKIIEEKMGQQSLILFSFSCSCEFYETEFFVDSLLPLTPVGARRFLECLIFYGWLYFKWKMFLALKNWSERKFRPQVQRLPNGIWHATFPVTAEMKRRDRDAHLGDRHLGVYPSSSCDRGVATPLYSSLLSCHSKHNSTQSWSRISH